MADREGRVLGEGTAGPGNPRAVGIEAAAEAWREAVEEAWRGAGRAFEPARVAYLGVAGAGAAGERERLAAVAREHGLARKVEVASDLGIAHAGAFGDAAGIVVVAGTGSAAYGRNAAGREHRAGGLGSWLDDGGSAWDLGRRALAACLRASDGRAAPTALGEVLARRLGLASWRDLARHAPLPRVEVAELARDVCAAARAGDQTARTILADGARELACAARAVARALELEQPTVALAGGAATDATYRAEITRALERDLPDLHAVRPAGDPLEGALHLALRRLMA